MSGAARRTRGPQGPRVRGGSREARQRAAAILEVLAGERSPQEAASALGVSVPRYYALEGRALAGLLSACEPAAPGKRASPGREAERLRQEVERLRRECGRRQALLRAAQRAMGLAPSPPEAKEGRKRRRGVVRALRAAGRLREEAAGPELPEVPREGGE